MVIQTVTEPSYIPGLVPWLGRVPSGSNICNLVCSHKLSVIGNMVWPTKINTDKGTLRRTAQCYCPLWFLDQPYSLVTILTMSAEISIEMGPNLDFNAVFYLTRAGLSQKIGQYQKPKSTIANSTVLSKVVSSELPLVDQLWSLQIHLCTVIQAHKYLNL